MGFSPSPTQVPPTPHPLESAKGPSPSEMLILSRSSKLRLLEGTLRRHLPETLPVTWLCLTALPTPQGQDSTLPPLHGAESRGRSL